MIIVKAKSSKSLSIVGTVIFGAYALIRILIVINDLSFFGFDWRLMSFVYTVAKFFAFFNIWLAENGKTATKNKISAVIKTPLEDNLVSLKQLYDSGAITEQEYNQKKTEILNKL